MLQLVEKCVDSPLTTVPEEAGEVKLAVVENEEVSPARSARTKEAGVCVDVIDLGVVNTPYGPKHQLKFVFELGSLKSNGYPQTVSRTFTSSFYKKSALRPALEAWLGCPLDEHESVMAYPFTRLVGKGCTLRLLPTISEAGNAYMKIESIKPAKTALKPSGTYRRWQS